MHFTYRTKGTCSQEILFDVDGKTVKNIEFIGGCNCGMKETSCPDQLANALKKAREKLAEEA